MVINSRNGILQLSYSVNGKFKRKSLKMKDTRENRKLVEKDIIPNLEREMASKTYIDRDEVLTIVQMKDRSFAMNRSKRNEKTQKDYERAFSLHIEPTFGKKKLDEVKASDIEVWQNDLLVTLSHKRVELCRIILGSIYKSAIKDEQIKFTPVSVADAVGKQPVRDRSPFSLEEMHSIINTISENMRCYAAMGFFTAMRTGELLGLKWGDIDLDNRIITVQRSRSAGRDMKPKTKSSIRDIEIIDSLVPFIEEHRKQYAQSEYVFTTRNEKPFASGEKILETYWKPTLKKLGIDYRPQYQMRHTFASMMLSNGEDILWVSNMMGHKNSQTTLEVYAQYMPTQKKERASFLTAHYCTKTAHGNKESLKSA